MRARALAIGVAALLAGCGGEGVGDDDADTPPRTETTEVEVVQPAQSGGDFDPAQIYDRDGPGVVQIFAVSEDSLEGGGLGSGFVLNGRGEIATNAHVVTQGEDEDIEVVGDVFVDFPDGNRVPAEVLGVDPDADVALIKVDPAGLQLRPLSFGDVDAVEVGDPVAAIGSPFGQSQTLTTGIVSAIDRDIQSLTQFSIPGAIQTDAAINPGNSGGPLVNAAGEVIGLNQQIRTESGASDGVGFAVPADLAQRSIGQIREQGEVTYAFLGVSTVELYPQLTDEFELGTDTGAWVQEVTDGSPAEDAGVQAGGGRERTFQGATELTAGGDVIVKLDRFDIRDPSDLAEAVALLEPDQTVSMVVLRDDRRRTLDVQLADRPE